MLLNLCTRLWRSPAISPLGHCIFLPQVGSVMDWAVEVEAIWASFDIYLSPWQNASAPRTKEMTHEWNLDFPNAINSIAVPYCVTKKLCFKTQSLAEFKGKRHENNSWSIAHRWRSETDPMVPPPKIPKSKVRWHGLRRALSAMRVTLKAEKDWTGWMFEVSTLNSTL